MDWSNQAGSSFGISVATAGDVNGDGFSDVLVGACLFDNGQNDEGKVFAYYGSASYMFLSYFHTNKKHQSMSIIFLICLGILIEYLQQAMHLGRANEILDVVANVLGILKSVGLFKFVKGINHRKR